MPIVNQENNLVIDGFESNLTVTDGFGFDAVTIVDDATGPGATNINYVAEAKALFITQFRQVREY